MKKNEIYVLEDRGLLFITGEDSKSFLQNIVTNDINKVSETSSCFSALLTPQGKCLYEFIISKHKSGYFLDCEKDTIEDLMKQLNIYKLRSKIEILNLSNEFVVAALTRDKFISIDGSKDFEGYTSKFREDTILLDPRDKELGGRLIINLEKLYLSLKKLELKTSSIERYYEHSHKLGIVQSSTKLLQNKLFGIECNFEELNAIDFKKGCYIGQENTARIKLKEKLKKRLFAIEKIEGELTEDLIFHNNVEIGKILINGQYPFAIIKYKTENFDFEDIYHCGNAKLKIYKPKWI